MIARFLAVALLSCACLTLGACGKKGSPYAPDKVESDFPHKYPRGSSSGSGAASQSQQNSTVPQGIPGVPYTPGGAPPP